MSGTQHLDAGTIARCILSIHNGERTLSEWATLLHMSEEQLSSLLQATLTK
jgi:AraC-like DNA-binding protein